MRVLGIQCWYDSSVAIINDGLLEGYYKEERYTGIKRDVRPYKAFLQANSGKFDQVCIDYPNHGMQNFVKKFIDVPVVYYADRHHLSHASLAFYNSGFEDCLVFVIDRDGSTEIGFKECETVFKASYPCEFETLHKNYWASDLFSGGDNNTSQSLLKKDKKFSCNSNSKMGICLVYETGNTLIGQGQRDSGKTMGLAAYGSDKPFDAFFSGDTLIDSHFVFGRFSTNDTSESSSDIMPIYQKYVDKITLKVTPNNYKFYADYAYQVQKQTQERVLNFVKSWVDKTGIKKVCLTGGYSMNVVTNGYLVENLKEIEFYFEPMGEDSGNSVGMAMHMYRSITEDRRIHKIKTTFAHGHKIVPVLNNTTLCSVNDIANYLSNSKIVAVFNGLSETGHRALGNRSILFDARVPNGRSIINGVKRREWYRPFAGSVLKEDFNKYFETHGLSESPFMTISFPCLDKSIPAITHVDGSCRVQTVDSEVEHLYNLLHEFKKITGCSVLLNTSYNLSGQPLVETADEAISVFLESSIDVLWFPELNACMYK